MTPRVAPLTRTVAVVQRSSPPIALGAAIAAVAAVTAGFRAGLGVTNPTSAALLYLFIVLVTAASSPLWVAILTSVVADLCLNYFFMPPFGTLIIADPQNWLALFVFLGVSVIAGRLSSAARARERESTARRDELGRLFDLSRDILLTNDSQEAIGSLAGFIARRFELDFAAICLPRAGEWDVLGSGSAGDALAASRLSAIRAKLERGVRVESGDGASFVPLRLGTKDGGLLAAAGRPIEPGTLDAIAGVVAIAIERAQFLEERKSAEIARQSDQLKTALLASLAHDLRTPLTAIRVAASNLQASWLADEDRHDQSDLILAEVERLTRLFQNILEMARIDAGAVSPAVRWVHPLEIVEAARDQIEHTLRDAALEIEPGPDVLVRVDPRVTASALAHVMENAVQYGGGPIQVSMDVSAEGLRVTVRDHGPGITAADLPHLFERFYRGADAKRRASGTGMGLAIARGLLAAEQGRMWAETCPDGGARFSIVVPAELQAAMPVEQTS